MLGWIRIYGHPCAGPAGPARALAGNRKSKKRKENIWIQALKTKTIRTALKFLKTHKNNTPESPKYLQLWFSLVQTFGDSGDHACNRRTHLSHVKHDLEKKIRSRKPGF